MSNFSKFEDKVGVTFKDKDLLRQAFVHRSYLNENPALDISHNERLEFLGDAVLELAITEELYKKFPEKPEGELTTLRAALVNSKMLSDVALEIGMNEFLLLSRGEARDVGRARQFILANAIEALIGAIYLDQGYEAAEAFILNTVSPRLEKVLEQNLHRDPKSLFQEEAQERVGITPTYEVIREWGPDHDKHFVIGVYLKNELVAEGEGPSKQAAQEEAARLALMAKDWS
ncbi:MAG: Ribonuclease 3 [Parcubacteria group bacterium GW2011_GWB1_52_7]|nr:MAG: Ribonuclease 3 [Parcubacteria group bacterium GW2011_GWA1_51_12]KKW28424.1 MAG: Ribonuclease 3 [Parcubacteria group bacterium GW2011_GWB1_52_7]KKW30708.1 MAG: Ribonuclease 3 [Parcubacteria group bacterium GW2011_GWC2_52_8c]